MFLRPSKPHLASRPILLITSPSHAIHHCAIRISLSSTFPPRQPYRHSAHCGYNTISSISAISLLIDSGESVVSRLDIFCSDYYICISLDTVSYLETIQVVCSP